MPKKTQEKKGKKSKSSSKMTVLDEKKHDSIKEKPYITKEIETSITLLESPETSIVLEALLFLSKYADIQKNNLRFLQSSGILPKLLALLDHNICILRVSLRLLAELLKTGAAQVELNADKFDKQIQKICGFYTSHGDVHIKEFSIDILATYATLGKAGNLLAEPNLIKAVLRTIKAPENDSILNSTLELFNSFLEIKAVREALPKEENFHLDTFVAQMSVSDGCFKTILAIFEKMTYFGEDELQFRLKECKLIEHLFNIIVDPNKQEHVATCLNVVMHCMRNENTNSYFVQSLEFLKFCQWVKTCAEEAILSSVSIFLELSKIDSIRQMLFDLSVEDSILSFLRSNDKKVLNITCEAITFMSKHKYCCEKMLTPVVIKKILQILERTNDTEDSYNETALKTLYYFARRDSRTLHMIHAYGGVGIMLKYLSFTTSILSEHSYRQVLEIINMFVTSNQLQSSIFSLELYDVILTQTSSEFDEICMRTVEIMINCLNRQDFQDYFLLNKGSQIVIDKLSSTDNENVIKMLTIFVHNALMFENMSHDLIHNKLLLILKRIPENIKYKNPLIDRVINLVYNKCLPLKFFETGRLEFVDKLNEKFYIITGPWSLPFPFLEILELRRMSTLSTIYVIEDMKNSSSELMCNQCYDIQNQHRLSLSSNGSVSSVTSASIQSSINFGRLSHDPYLPKYVDKMQQLVLGISSITDKVRILAEFVDCNLCGPKENCELPDKIHNFKLHIECIKEKLGTNMIPIGYLRLGFHCEKALLFKALADQVYIPATLVKGKSKLYWNEIALLQSKGGKTFLRMFVVDLMNNIGQLLPVGSRECNAYCDIQ